MGEVTIDSIQIEIESNSANASKGLDALAGSLEKLKKNGSFKTVSTNLNNLSTALQNLPNVHSASNALRTLANSIEKLKGVGSVSSLTNSLAKLPAALKSLSSINLDKVAPQIQKVADTVAPLSSIKAGGLNTMINSMKKLGEVTKSLDDETIENFAKKVELLNQKLTPLATKMTTIKTGFNAINSSARQASASIEEFGDDINASALNMSSFISIAQAVVSALTMIVQKLSEFIHQASEWDGIATRFGKGFGEQAQETYEWIQLLNEKMGINVQQFMQYSSLYATMLKGFGVASEDAHKMALGYTELTYDIWASANDRYKTFQDAADAVASAIAGEVEPIRRAGFTIVEATLQETAAYHGLDISIANATESQKSYLRYLTLVDQAHKTGVIGTYAKELNTAEGMMRTFSQQLKSLAQAFGSLFLPILVKVMPWLQAFVELLEEGVRWIAGFLNVEIQDIGNTWNNFDSGAGSIDNVASSAGNASNALNDATKAAKELKNATLGIDELNVISPTSDAGGSTGSGGGAGAGGGAGGGLGGLDIDSLWDKTIFDDIQSDVDAIKEKLRGWMPVIASIAATLAGMRLIKLLDDIKLIENTKLFTGKVKGLFGWVSAFSSLAKEGGILAALAAAFPKISKWLTRFSGDLGAFFALAKEGGIMQALAAAFPKIANAISKIAPRFGLIGLIIAAVVSVINFLVKNWEKLKEVVVNFFDEKIAPKLEEIKKHFDKLKKTLEPLKPVFEKISVAVKWLGDAFSWLFEAIGGVLTSILGAGLSGAINALVGAFEGLVQTISGVVQIIAGLFELIVGIFTGDGEKIQSGAEKIGAGVVDAFEGMYDSTIGAVVDLFDGVIAWFTEMWDVLVGHSIVPDTINEIVKWFKSLPDSILGDLGDFVQGIIDKFSNLGKSISDKLGSVWEAIKTWWNNKPGLESYVPAIGDIKTKLSDAWTAAKNWWDKTKGTLATYTPSIGKIWENLKAAWETAKTWWSKNRGSLSTYTPSIGKIWEKLKASWENAKTWWSKNRGSLSTYTPSIGKIWEKLKSSWNSAKTWWSKNKGSMSYTPSIGSIKDKVVSAWNSAKSWWKNNVGGLTTKLNISVPKLTVNWGEVSALGKTFKYPKSFSVKFAADGGIFDAGSLIWAGERGAEIVANAGGGKTGVMNVQQMQDAVYEGVYAAMMSAMRGNSGGGSSQVIKVYLDGKEITHSVEQHQRERGASIMGNEVYSY